MLFLWGSVTFLLSLLALPEFLQRLLGLLLSWPQFITSLAGLLLAQIWFNYYSSYQLKPTLTNFYLNLGIQYRMSWWPLHYLFLFLLGGVVATKYDQAYLLLKQNYRLLRSLLIVSLLTMLAHYYGSKP